MGSYGETIWCQWLISRRGRVLITSSWSPKITTLLNQVGPPIQPNFLLSQRKIRATLQNSRFDKKKLSLRSNKIINLYIHPNTWCKLYFCKYPCVKNFYLYEITNLAKWFKISHCWQDSKNLLVTVYPLHRLNWVSENIPLHSWKKSSRRGKETELNNFVSLESVSLPASRVLMLADWITDSRHLNRK